MTKTQRNKAPKHWSGMPQGFWTYDAPDPGEAPEGFKGNWFSLSPGMRREIKRDMERRAAATQGASQ